MVIKIKIKHGLERKIRRNRTMKEIKEEVYSMGGTWDAFILYLDENGRQMKTHYYNFPMYYEKYKYFEVKISDKYKFHVDYEDIVLLIVNHKVLVDNSKKKNGRL